MITLENGLYLRVQELQNGPKPFPLQSGFNPDTAYRALGMFSPSETSDAYFILSNDRDEVWFICNRHLRTVALVASNAGHWRQRGAVAPAIGGGALKPKPWAVCAALSCRGTRQW